MITKRFILLAISTFGLVFTTSCSTTKGFGQDLQKVGSRLENQAESTGGTAPAPSAGDVSAY
jgi:predicted small secreted protein